MAFLPFLVAIAAATVVVHVDGLDNFRRVTSVCSTCDPPTGDQGLRVENATCAAAGGPPPSTLAGCAAACAGDDCVAFGFLP